MLACCHRGTLSAAEPLDQLESALPRRVDECDAQHVQQVVAAAQTLEAWAAARTWFPAPSPAHQVVGNIQQLIEAKARVDRCEQRILELRTQFAPLEPAATRRERIRPYLSIASHVIRIAGQLRYFTRDAIENATYLLDASQPPFRQLVDLLIQHRVQVGADAMAYMLFDPGPEEPLQPFPDALKKKALQLIGVAGDIGSLHDLAEYVREPGVTPELMIEAAEAIRRLGLPQDPRPEGDDSDPAVPLTARQLLDIVNALPLGRGSPALQQRRAALSQWLDQRARQGVLGDTFRLGTCEVRSGDWLLMRNPSPYNLFTDLSPGLFTHVGVVTVEVGADGLRRFVVVDLPERGDHIPASNVDSYVSRTLHYFFLRHTDPQVGSRMGDAAREVIGNESQFDLLFRTSGVESLRGKSLQQQPIHTYCAGLLLLCAQQTGLPREEFFPIVEEPAGGYCVENLLSLGLSIGDRFVSPTGAIFAPRMEIAGRCEPMYDPTRDIKEAVYDHFAQRMCERKLVPSPDLSQMLVEKLARVSKTTPWLARALARANRVSEHMDLEAAAKAAAVVATLDDIANACVDEFLPAREAVISADLPPADQEELTAQQQATRAKFRQRHQELVSRWQQHKISPLELRRELVRFYTAGGKERLDERFFPVSAQK
jgi:hypothetical protein